jgi:hypothetical protein
VSRAGLGPTQPPIQWVLGALSLGINRPGREADYSPPSSAKVKEYVMLYLHYPNTSSWCGAWLKHRDNFTFTFYLTPRVGEPSKKIRKEKESAVQELLNRYKLFALT